MHENIYRDNLENQNARDIAKISNTLASFMDDQMFLNKHTEKMAEIDRDFVTKVHKTNLWIFSIILVTQLLNLAARFYFGSI